MKESQIQTQIKKKLEEHGWYVVKLIQTNKNGIPDLMAIRKGNVIFLEVKTDDGVVAPLQEHRIKELNSIGVFARVVRSVEDINVFCHKGL